MSKDTISEVERAARSWVDAVSERKRWRVQVLSMRYREDPVTHERRELPLRIRRFAEGCPASGMKHAIDYLLSKAPYTGVIFNGEELDGSYLPTLTTWRRDDGDTQNRSRQYTDGTYTIVQDLVDRRFSDSYDVQTQSSCSGVEETRYEWDAPSIEDVAVGSQGVTYAVQAVGRNEDGTFNYQYVCRRAVTQHVAETVTEDDALHTTTVESWDNVYMGADGAYVNQDGETVAIPAPGVVVDAEGNPTGTVVRISAPVENQDCTLKIQVVRETTKNVLVRDHSSHTQFEGDHDERVAGAALPLGLAPDPATDPGNIREHTSERQADGRYVNTVGTKVERAVAASAKEVRVGRRGRRVTVTDVNQSVPASTDSVRTGGSVRVEKTPGNLFNNTVSTWERTDEGPVGESCQDSLYEHVDRRTEAGVDSVPTDHVSGGTGGRVVSRTTDMDDEGAITQTTETKQERTVLAAEESWQVNIDGVAHVTKDRSAEAPAPAPAYSRDNVGKSVHNVKTPGGWYDVTTSELDRAAGTLDSESVCSRTVFEHVDASSVTDPNGSVVSPDHVEAGDGHVRRRTARLNSSGSVTTTTEDTSEVASPAAEKSVRKTPRATITTTVDRNGTAQASSDVGVGETSSHVRTPGGLYNLTTTKVAANAAVDSARSSASRYETEEDEVTLKAGPVDTTSATGGSGGITRVKTSELDEYGIAKTVVRETREQSVPNAEVTYRRMTRGLIKTTVDRNGTTPASDPGASAVGGSSSHTVTPGGLYNLTTVEVSASNLNDSAYHANTVFEDVDDNVTLGTGEVDNAKPSAAGGGKTHVKTSQLDEYGFVRTADRVTTEKAKAGAQVSYRRTSRGLIKTTVDRNGTTQASAPASPGCESAHRMTDGGLYDLTTVTLDASKVADSARCEKTYFVHVHDSVTPGTGAVDATEPPDAGGGASYTKTSDLDNDGFVRTVLRETKEIQRNEAELSYRRTARGVVRTVTDRSCGAKATDPGAGKVGCSSTHRMTNGGLYDLTTVTLEASSKNDRAYHQRTWTEETDDVVKMSTGEVDDTAPEEAGGGYHRTKTSDLDDLGFVRTAVRKVHEVPRESHSYQYEADHFSTTESVTDKNKTSASAAKPVVVGADADSVVTSRVVTNPGGSVDETTTTVTATYRDWDFEIDVCRCYRYQHWFVNATSADVQSVKQTVMDKYDAKVEKAGRARQPSSYSFSPSLTLNKFGRYDGSIGFGCDWSSTSAGQTDAENEVFYNITYTRKDRSYSSGVKDGANGRYVITDQYEVLVEAGRGHDNFVNLTNNIFDIVTMSGSIDPTTKVYNVNRTRFIDSTVKFEED
jgi:hypothetical protein